MPIEIIAALAGFLAGTAGAMGLGGGSILLLYLTLVAGEDQLHAQGINLLFFIPCAAAALWFHQKDGRVPWRIVIPAALWGLPGAAAGFWLSGRLGGQGTGKLFALFLLALGIRELLFPPQKSSAGRRQESRTQNTHPMP